MTGTLIDLNLVYLAPGTGVIGFIPMVEITLVISLLQTLSLTSHPPQTLRLVLHSQPPHREVGEGGEAEAEIAPVEMAFRR